MPYGPSIETHSACQVFPPQNFREHSYVLGTSASPCQHPVIFPRIEPHFRSLSLFIGKINCATNLARNINDCIGSSTQLVEDFRKIRREQSNHVQQQSSARTFESSGTESLMESPASK